MNADIVLQFRTKESTYSKALKLSVFVTLAYDIRPIFQYFWFRPTVGLHGLTGK